MFLPTYGGCILWGYVTGISFLSHWGWWLNQHSRMVDGCPLQSIFWGRRSQRPSYWTGRSTLLLRELTYEKWDCEVVSRDSTVVRAGGEWCYQFFSFFRLSISVELPRVQFWICSIATSYYSIWIVPHILPSMLCIFLLMNISFFLLLNLHLNVVLILCFYECDVQCSVKVNYCLA